MGHSACAKDFQACSVNVEEWIGAEGLSYVVGSGRVVRSNSDLNPFSRKLPWSCIRLRVNLFYVAGRGEIEFKSVARGE